MKKESTWRLVALIAILSAFPPLATDMYLPALPSLEKQWNAPLSIVNLTLVCFFISYCFFLLIYGPLADRFGRKPPLIGGILVYISACFLCATAPSIYHLIVYRILQAAGSAAASAIAMAIIKDRIPGTRREQTMAQVAIITTLAPMIAPLIGGAMMSYFSWPYIFISQAILGIISLIGVIFMRESLDRSKIASRSFIQRYIKVFKNGRFISLVLVISIIGSPIFAFIGGSSDIYITRLGLSEGRYGILFGGNAIFFMFGSFTCSRLAPRFGGMRLMTLGFSGVFIGGLVMIFLPISGFLRLALPMSFITFCLGLSRPPSNNIALEQVEEDAGSASSILIFLYFVMGAVSMAFISFDWKDKIQTIGIMATFSGAFCLTGWYLIRPKLKLPYIRTKKVKA